jgi:tRNA(fMet)-specific endonuclease VapC
MTLWRVVESSRNYRKEAGLSKRVMLDTNICIYIIKRRPQSVLERFSSFPVGDIGISTITLDELEYGAAKSAQPRKNREALEAFVSPLDVAAFDRDAAEAYGRIRPALERKGLPIGAMDMLVAAHALSLSANLVTNNEAEFRRVSGLRAENWI